ncbi:rRNA maturation RNAse YbeY, partial [Candidatus Pelagibacter sp.]|nr:rRNA maturation RNAse YbeY [Candidatus Pelagibacter sp.]
VVSYEFINKPKALSTLEFKSKVTKIFIHGFLHLLGHDHVKLKDFKKMLIEEEKIYQTIETKIVKLV